MNQLKAAFIACFLMVTVFFTFCESAAETPLDLQLTRAEPYSLLAANEPGKIADVVMVVTSVQGSEHYLEFQLYFYMLEATQSFPQVGDIHIMLDATTFTPTKITMHYGLASCSLRNDGYHLRLAEGAKMAVVQVYGANDPETYSKHFRARRILKSPSGAVLYDSAKEFVSHSYAVKQGEKDFIYITPTRSMLISYYPASAYLVTISDMPYDSITCDMVSTPSMYTPQVKELFPADMPFSGPSSAGFDVGNEARVGLKIEAKRKNFDSVAIRCSGVWNNRVVSEKGILVGLVVGSAVYGAHVTHPVVAEPDPAAVWYAPITTQPNFNVTEAASALAGLVPDWLKDSLTLGVTTLSNGTGAVTMTAVGAAQIYLSKASLFTQVIDNLTGARVITPDGMDDTTLTPENLFTRVTKGVWGCDTAGDGTFTGECIIANSCSSTYTAPLGCVTPDGILDGSTLAAHAACSVSPAPPSLPETSGCGELMCVSPVDGAFVSCSHESVCVAGCEARVEITPSLIATAAVFEPVCIKNGARVDSAHCLLSTAPQYAAECDAVSTCGPVCVNSNSTRVACDDEAAWSECSETCGAGTQTIDYHCSDTTVLLGEAVAAPAPAELCGDWSSGPGFSVVRACEGTLCPTWLCTPSADPSAQPGDCEQVSFPACPSDGCGLPAPVTRSVGCYIGTDAVDAGECDALTAPAEAAPCSLVTSLCTALFNSSTSCLDSDGEVATCHNTTGPVPTRAGECVNETDSPVPAAWCDDVALEQECDLHPCGFEARWVETVDPDCYSGSDAVCLSYRPVTSVCETRPIGSDDDDAWTAAEPADCGDLPAPAEHAPCPEAPACATGGRCVPTEGHQGPTGVCDCPYGYTGPLCQEAPANIVVRALPTNPGSYRIEWALPSSTPANAVAVISLRLVGDEAIGGGLLINLGATDASDRALEFVATEVGARLAEYTALVDVSSGILGESAPFTITPGCAAEGAICFNGGQCDVTAGVCVCDGEWQGAVCEISPCVAKECNPDGSTCTVTAAGFAQCDCITDSHGAPLFMGSRCFTPVAPCAVDPDSQSPVAHCANGGVPSGTFDRDGNPICTGCACENMWGGDTCEECGLTCYNGGIRDEECSMCDCNERVSGYRGVTCRCRHMYLKFVVLADTLAFMSQDTVPAGEQARLLKIFATAFGFDLSVAMGGVDVQLGSTTTATTKRGQRYLTLSFHVGHSCPIRDVEVDSRMGGVYDGVKQLKSRLTALYPSSLPFTSLDSSYELISRLPTLSQMHVPAGFGAYDPNCEPSKEECPTGWRGNGLLPDDDNGSEAGGDDDETEGETKTPGGSDSLSTGAIVGIAVGGSAFLILLLVLISFVAKILCFAAKTGPGPSAAATETVSV